MSNSFANIRKDYLKNILNEKQIHADPFLQFKQWMDEAVHAGIEEPNAMILSTVSEKGFPSSRAVLLKETKSTGFVFFTNYNSRKGKHLQHNPNGALLFFWKELERQIRIEGIVEKIDTTESDAYFHNRPIESQINAIISPQSEKIADRATLEKWRNDFINSNAEIKRPEHWGGYILIPKYFEFWQGRQGRLHDRISYCGRKNHTWEIHRLAP